MIVLMMILTVLLMGVAYLLGSLSSAILVCRALKLPDPRTQGSGNPGATNVLRFGGKKAAIITLLGDMAKGFLPVLFAKLIGASDLACALIGLAAFIGHIYPIFFDFRGGKGVATALGVIAGLSLFLGAMSALTWFAIYALFRYSSVAAIVTAAVAPIYLLLLGYFGAFAPVLVMSLMIMWRHKENFKRLVAGTEPKAG